MAVRHQNANNKARKGTVNGVKTPVGRPPKASKTRQNGKKTAESSIVCDKNAPITERAATAKHEKDIFAAEKLRLEVELLRKDLVSEADAKQRWQNALSMLRDRFDNAPLQFKRQFPDAPKGSQQWLRAFFATIVAELKKVK